MADFQNELVRRLEEIRGAGLYRHLRAVDSPQAARISIEGKEFINFSSNDYLGLANHPLLKEAARRAIEEYGAGSGASRLISGSLQPHVDLEAALARLKQTEAALSFSSGYAAAIGAVCAVVSRGDVIILDKLVHASIVDAARLSGAKLRVFRHNDVADLEKILQWASEAGDGPERSNTLVVTESVFSMDGDLAPLREMVALKQKYGAWLMVDEAHSTGLHGAQGRGLAAEFGLEKEIEIQMGTLGKAFGAAGGFIAGSSVLIDFLINRARSFIFSTAPVPAASAAALAGVQLANSAEGENRRARLWKNVEFVQAELRAVPTNRSAICPIQIGGEKETLSAAAALRKLGLFVPAVRYPTVPRGAARLRVSVTASHSESDIARLSQGLKECGLVQT